MTPKPAAHTPTPWSNAGDNYGNIEVDSVARIRKGGLYLVCTMFGSMPREEQKANAALIVRAVNAHEELIAMLKGELLERGDERRYTRDEIKQLIAKAESQEGL